MTVLTKVFFMAINIFAVGLCCYFLETKNNCEIAIAFIAIICCVNAAIFSKAEITHTKDK